MTKARHQAWLYLQRRLFVIIINRCQLTGTGVFHPRLELLPWTKGDNTTSSNWNIFSGFRIASRTLTFEPQLKITKTRDLNLFAIFQRSIVSSISLTGFK